MAVSPGNRVSASVTNSAFLSRTQDSSTTGSLDTAKFYIHGSRIEPAAAVIASLASDVGQVLIDGATDTDITGVAAGSDGQVLHIINNMAANSVTLSFPASPVVIAVERSVSLQFSTLAAAWFILEVVQASAFPDFTTKYAVIEEQQPIATTAGTFTSGAFQTRNLNTVRAAQTWAALAANQVTLQPGNYKMSCYAIAFRVDIHQCRIQNITDASTETTGSTSFNRSNANDAHTESLILSHFVQLGVAKIFELQHRCFLTRATDGFGRANQFNIGIFSQLQIEKLDI